MKRFILLLSIFVIIILPSVSAVTLDFTSGMARFFEHSVINTPGGAPDPTAIPITGEAEVTNYTKINVSDDDFSYLAGGSDNYGNSIGSGNAHMIFWFNTTGNTLTNDVTFYLEAKMQAFVQTGVQKSDMYMYAYNFTAGEWALINIFDETDNGVDTPDFLPERNYNITITTSNFTYFKNASNMMLFMARHNVSNANLSADYAWLDLSLADAVNLTGTIPNITLAEDTSNTSLDMDDYFLSDADLNWTSIVSTTNVSIIVDNDTGIMNVTPVDNWFGTAYANITATSQTGGTNTSNNFVITVTSVNDAPSISTFRASPSTGQAPPGINATLNITVTDVDTIRNVTINYTINGVGSSLINMTNVEGNVYQKNLTLNVVGTYDFTIKEIDVEGNSAKSNFLSRVVLEAKGSGGDSGGGDPPPPPKPPETCVDGIQNQDEEGIDCGGVCVAVCMEENKTNETDVITPPGGVEPIVIIKEVLVPVQNVVRDTVDESKLRIEDVLKNRIIVAMFITLFFLIIVIILLRNTNVKSKTKKALTMHKVKRFFT